MSDVYYGSSGAVVPVPPRFFCLDCRARCRVEDSDVCPACGSTAAAVSHADLRERLKADIEQCSAMARAALNDARGAQLSADFSMAADFFSISGRWARNASERLGELIRIGVS